MHNQVRLTFLILATVSAVCALGQTPAAQPISLESIASVFAVNSGAAQSGNSWADIKSVRGIRFSREYSTRQDYPKSLDGKAKIMALGLADIAFAGVQSIVEEAEVTIEGVGIFGDKQRGTLVAQLPSATSITSVQSCHLPSTRFYSVHSVVLRGKKPIFIEMVTSEGSGGDSLIITFVQQLGDLDDCK